MYSEGKQDEIETDMPLVKMSLENITFVPLMKGFTSPSKLNTYLTNKKKDDTEAKVLLRKTILKNVSPPAIDPYTLHAWMGPSGSGKTSLLSIAAGMTEFDPDSFSDDSRITINDDAQNVLSKKGGFPKGLSGVVWQDDLLLSNLTVRETIEFAAKLKTPRSQMYRIQQMVDEVLDDLGLSAIGTSLIGQSDGGPGRGISGGERKRVSVAQELVTRPPLIFLDEPTSGLDSTTALELMQTLKDLCQKGHSIVTVIHQPRTKIFDLVDGLLLLSQGDEIYSGPACGARKVLESCPIIGFDLPDQTNIADWMMDLIVEDEDRIKSSRASTAYGDEEASGAGSKLLPIHWQHLKGEVESCGDNKTNNTRMSNRLSTLAEIKNSVPKYTASFGTQMKLLTRRAVKQTRGEKISNASIIATCAYIVFESAFWFRLSDNTNRIYERNSLVFFLIISQANGIVIASVPTFRRDRALLTRERSKKMYRVLPYFLAKTLAGKSEYSSLVWNDSFKNMFC